MKKYIVLIGIKLSCSKKVRYGRQRIKMITQKGKNRKLAKKCKKGKSVRYRWLMTQMTTQKWRTRRGAKKCKKWKGIIKHGWLTNDNSKVEK